MSMVIEHRYKCDQCGKEELMTQALDKGKIPFKWYTLSQFHGVGVQPAKYEFCSSSCVANYCIDRSSL